MGGISRSFFNVLLENGILFSHSLCSIIVSLSLLSIIHVHHKCYSLAQLNCAQPLPPPSTYTYHIHAYNKEYFCCCCCCCSCFLAALAV